MGKYDEQRRPVALISLDGRDASLANRRMYYAEEKSKPVERAAHFGAAL
jgi:hypothetical protein